MGLWMHISKKERIDESLEKGTVSLSWMVELSTDQLVTNVLEPSSTTLWIGGNDEVTVFNIHGLGAANMARFENWRPDFTINDSLLRMTLRLVNNRASGSYRERSLIPKRRGLTLAEAEIVDIEVERRSRSLGSLRYRSLRSMGWGTVTRG